MEYFLETTLRRYHTYKDRSDYSEKHNKYYKIDKETYRKFKKVFDIEKEEMFKYLEISLTRAYPEEQNDFFYTFSYISQDIGAGVGEAFALSVHEFDTSNNMKTLLAEYPDATHQRKFNILDELREIEYLKNAKNITELTKVYEDGECLLDLDWYFAECSRRIKNHLTENKPTGWVERYKELFPISSLDNFYDY